MRMSTVLASNGIGHHPDDRGPQGGHEWPYGIIRCGNTSARTTKESFGSPG